MTPQDCTTSLQISRKDPEPSPVSLPARGGGRGLGVNFDLHREPRRAVGVADGRGGGSEGERKRETI